MGEEISSVKGSLQLTSLSKPVFFAINDLLKESKSIKLDLTTSVFVKKPDLPKITKHAGVVGKFEKKVVEILKKAKAFTK